VLLLQSLDVASYSRSDSDDMIHKFFTSYASDEEAQVQFFLIGSLCVSKNLLKQMGDGMLILRFGGNIDLLTHPR